MLSIKRTMGAGASLLFAKFFFVMCFGVMSFPTHAQTQQLTDRCVKVTDPDQKIANCTTAITSRLWKGYWKGKGLAWAFYNRGSGYEGKQDFNRAIADYSEAIRRNPKDGGFYWARGHAYSAKKEYDRAISDLNTAIRLNPKNGWFFHDRGWAYFNKQDYDRAVADFAEAIRSKSDAEFFFGRGFAYERKGQYDRSLQDYDQAIKLNPSMARAFYYRSLLKDKNGDKTGATADMNEARRLDPNIGK